MSSSAVLYIYLASEQYCCILILDTTSGFCRDGFVQVKDWCFSFHLQPIGMFDMSQQCESQGAGLVTLDSAEKERALTRFIEGERVILKCMSM